jgi:hypothetical protein
MPLTVRSNGLFGSNIIRANWFNDYYNLLTGIMQDQEVTIKNNLVLQAIGNPPSVAPTATVVSGAGLGIGLYTYVYTFTSPDGESLPSPGGNGTTSSTNQQINLSAVAAGPIGTTGRKIYRTIVGGGTVYKFLAALADNTTTTYVDNAVDGSLGVLAPTIPTFGGALVIKDAAGVVRHVFGTDGTITPTTSGITVSGSITGTLTLYMLVQGTLKLAIFVENNYNSTTKSIVLPQPFTTSANFWVGNIGNTGGMQCLHNGTPQNVDIITGLSTSGGTDSAGQTTVFAHSFCECQSPFEVVQFPTTSNSGHTAVIFMVGS